MCIICQQFRTRKNICWIRVKIHHLLISIPNMENTIKRAGILISSSTECKFATDKTMAGRKRGKLKCCSVDFRHSSISEHESNSRISALRNLESCQPSAIASRVADWIQFTGRSTHLQVVCERIFYTCVCVCVSQELLMLAFWERENSSGELTSSYRSDWNYSEKGSTCNLISCKCKWCKCARIRSHMDECSGTVNLVRDTLYC